MNNRTEPTKEQNEAAIRALKREGRSKPPVMLHDAIAGAYSETEYRVIASADGCRRFAVARFPFDPYSSDHKETARILAEELADRINEQ